LTSCSQNAGKSSGFRLSIEVLTSYELAEIASISEGYDVGLDRTPVTA